MEQQGMDLLSKLPELVGTFASLGTVGWIVGLVFFVVMGGLIIYIMNWYKQKAIEAANTATQTTQEQTVSNAQQENHTVAQASHEAEDDIEAKLNGKE